ncbi:MAG TPA: hypothetical protein PLU71_05075 [Candidatus Dependentiae bacterium]|nr:hypothetical protein [Candidatus Dependentiae bacterium]HRQ63207.1 hypothetical protein [Candidatus Dependentiae bacterium]
MKTLTQVNKALSLALLISVASAPAMETLRNAGDRVAGTVKASYETITTQAGKAGSWVAGQAKDGLEATATVARKAKGAVVDSAASAEKFVQKKYLSGAVKVSQAVHSKNETAGVYVGKMFNFPFAYPKVTKVGLAAVAATGLGLTAKKAYSYLTQAAAIEENKENNSQLAILAAQAKDAADTVAQGQKATFVAQSENVDTTVATHAQAFEQAVNSFNATYSNKARKTKRTIQREQAAQQRVAAAHAQLQKAIETAHVEQVAEVVDGNTLAAKASAARDTVAEYANLAWELTKENSKEVAAAAAVVAVAGYEALNAYYGWTQKYALSPWAKTGVVKAKNGVVTGFEKTTEAAKIAKNWTTDTAKASWDQMTVKNAKIYAKKTAKRIKKAKDSAMNYFARDEYADMDVMFNS